MSDDLSGCIGTGCGVLVVSLAVFAIRVVAIAAMIYGVVLLLRWGGLL